MKECNTYSVYIHEAPNGKRYIGITSTEPEIRWNYGHGYGHNKHFTSAINKYGWGNIRHTIVRTDLSKDDALELEKELILKYKSNDRLYGYNNSSGGEKTTLGYHFSEEQKKRMSEVSKNLWKNDDFRNRVIESMKKKGIKPPSRRGCVSENRKPVCQMSKSGELIAKFPSIKHAADAIGVTVMSISNVCNGKAKTSRGYIFRFEVKDGEES